MRSVQKISLAEVILGGFFFADYQRMSLMDSQLHTWIANPGLELLTKHQEARVQGYFPMGQRSQAYRAMMASDMPNFTLSDSGKANVALASGHNFIDAPVSLTHEYGVGVEAELGQYLPIMSGAWLRDGGYHFDYHNAQSVNGVEANIEIYTGKNFSFLVQDNYDNQNKNWFSLGVRLSFGGPDYTQVKQLRNRMEEPIIRHIARQPAGAATPIRESYVVTGPTQAMSDIWFFSPSGINYSSFSPNICTAEHPCQNLNQTIADGITATPQRARNLWFASGNYALPVNKGSQEVYLGDGQILSGRSADFRSSATAANRPAITGGLWWKGNGRFQDINITNNGQVNTVDSSVAALGAAGSLNVQNALISANAKGAYVFGVEANNNLVLSNSSVSASGDRLVVTALALNVLTVNNSQITALGIGGGQVFGIAGAQGMPPSNVVVKNSTVNASSTGSGSFVIGVYGANSGTVIVEDSIVTAKGSKIVVGVNNDGGNAEVRRTSINAEGGGNVVNGIFAQGSISAHAVDIVTTNNKSGQALALINNSGNISLTDSLLHVYSSGPAFGIAANSGGVFSSGNKIFVQALSTAPGGYVYGIFATQNVTMNSTTITVDNTSSAITGVTYGIFAGTGILFEGGQSTVAANSSTPASSNVIYSGGVVANNSTPKSQCSINGGASSNCG